MISKIDGTRAYVSIKKVSQVRIILRVISILSFLFLFPLTILINIINPLTIVIQFLGLVFLVNFLGELLHLLPWNTPWIYRSAYFLGISASILINVLNRQAISNIIFFLLIDVIAAFIGGLMITSFRWGLYENYSPSLDIMTEVKKRHKYLSNVVIRIPPLKRLFDIIFSILGLIITSPIWLLEIWLIWIEDPGPVLFVKNSTGQAGENIKLFKFRTMVRESGKAIGPYYVHKGDLRVLRSGRIFRKTALDELPQLLNIFWGDISFVGPRPHRTVVVHDYLRSLPEFAERHRVKPGLAGLAQVVGGNNLTPHQKLRLDRIYISHSSVGFDIKLLVLAFLVVFYLRWKKNWNGRIPRKWMRFKSDTRNIH